MEEAAKGKGIVTPISSLFPAEDAKKAAKRVQDAIAEKNHQLDDLRRFASDNTGLINLVARLSDHLHHDIMVPFGKAAFFPGSLVHTNEFMVLLGEGYYAQRTSKQTVEIFNRRGKALDSQVDSLNSMIDDLKVEGSFFDATAFESSEGLVEIREDYVEESPSGRKSEPGPIKQDPRCSSGANNRKVANEDGEFARILARMDELEKEELEAESELGSEEEKTKAEFEAQTDNVSDEYEEVKGGSSQFSNQKSLHQNLKFSKAPVESSKPEFDGQKAFTGSIVERGQNLETSRKPQPRGSQPSNPVSRFKTQRK